MIGRRNPAYGSASSSFQMFFSIGCTQKYNNYKNEIEQKISAFKKRKRADFKEWATINKFIKDKNNEITDCVTNKYISVDFYGDPDIKNFSEICTSDGKCNIQKTQDKKPAAPKTGKRGNCDFSQEKGTDKNVLQSKLPSDNTNGANPIGHQANVDPVVQKENLVAPLPSTHIHDTVSDVERDHSDGNSDNGVSTSVSYNVLDRVNGTSLGQPADEVPTSADSIVADTTDSVQFDSKGVGGADIGKLVIDSEHARVKTPCSEMPSTQAIHNGDSCIKEQDNELVHNNDNNLGIFNDIYQMILSNKDNMTNASIPIGIVLLLSLLFKYTSWWSLLTKKKRKKPAEMNQELHSVLQVPSIFDEERSIAFSYGAFEYSS
ncbi:hypothetical protein PVIIG_05642 [Plasmodium vivax India VII]|uniref:Variable surface protein Vir18 n=1 Tax=Plasmodium vivax India VII TaxID=1077284 RepID=A0A0J9S2Z9_PLAVI|nr:hypothetical protein PVIIG_05642 [Plasmodium vivax India VII]